jgi:hypothetical protein
MILSFFYYIPIFETMSITADENQKKSGPSESSFQWSEGPPLLSEVNKSKRPRSRFYNMKA